jgi:hypothetical protein
MSKMMEIELTIPARAAYQQRGSGGFLFGRKSRTTQEHAKENR